MSTHKVWYDLNQVRLNWTNWKHECWFKVPYLASFLSFIHHCSLFYSTSKSLFPQTVIFADAVSATCRGGSMKEKSRVQKRVNAWEYQTKFCDKCMQTVKRDLKTICWTTSIPPPPKKSIDEKRRKQTDARKIAFYVVSTLRSTVCLSKFKGRKMSVCFNWTIIVCSDVTTPKLATQLL